MGNMEDTKIEVDALEIADLEYDVGGVSSVEAAAGKQGNDVIVIWYVTPN